MNSYVGMTMIKKEQRQNYYFSQQSIHVLFIITNQHKSSESVPLM